jgi:hypothetical protein
VRYHRTPSCDVCGDQHPPTVRSRSLGVCPLRPVAGKSYSPPKVIAFYRPMGTPAPNAPPPAPAPVPAAPSWWQRHDTTAAWVAILFSFAALLISGAALLTTWHFRNMDRSEKISDAHTNDLIDAKLNPAVEKVNGNVDRKLDAINIQLQAMNRALGQVQEKLGIFASNQKKFDSRQKRGSANQRLTAHQSRTSR